MYFLSQFKQPKPEDFDVYVPLARAERHASVVAAHEKGLDMDLADEPDLKAIEAGADGEKGVSANTLAGLKAEIDADIAASGHDTMYDRKSKVINKAIQDIGMGPYQWKLFGLCGFGWLADNMWLQGVALTLPQLTAEFGPSSTQVRYTTCATFIGLCLGASFWGVASDVIGRRLAFNATLFIAGVFGLAVGGGNSWVGTCALYSCLGLGVGGNLYVIIKMFHSIIRCDFIAGRRTPYATVHSYSGATLEFELDPHKDEC
ncbi:MFS siderochrome iron transporter 1 [Physcia stellaris]|nr:MFS siderochrome iron transporter 1 [Physcia stellaris]